jgi:hypothetical protein
MTQRILRFLQTVLRFGIPIIFAVGIFAAVFEAINPWALADQYVPSLRNEHRVLVSFSRQSAYGGDGSETKGTYILVPGFFLTGDIYTVKKHSDGSVELEKSEVFPLLAILQAAIFVGLCVIAWRVPRIEKSPNPRMERTRVP